MIKGKMLGKGAEFRDAIQQAALNGMVDHKGGIYGTGRIIGYVCAIHDEDEGDEELMGTVDVQEYNCDSDDVNGQPIGFHQGVLLSAIQNNKSGYFIVPQLYSDVIIQQDPTTHDEYVVMYSHVSVYKLQVHDEITNTVTEYKDFVESDEDGLEKDYDELEETGNKSTVTQTSKGFTESIIDPDGNELKTERTAKSKTITVGDTKVFIDGKNVTIETSGNVTFKVGGSTIEEKDGTVDIQTDTANIKTSSATIEGDNIDIKGSSNVNITGGGTLNTKGTSSTDLNGPFNAIKVCPFSGAPHCGSKVSGI